MISLDLFGKISSSGVWVLVDGATGHSRAVPSDLTPSQVVILSRKQSQSGRNSGSGNITSA